MTVTATFEQQGGKTKLTLHTLHATVEDRRKHEDMGVVEGWPQTATTGTGCLQCRESPPVKCQI